MTAPFRFDAQAALARIEAAHLSQPSQPSQPDCGPASGEGAGSERLAAFHSIQGDSDSGTHGRALPPPLPRPLHLSQALTRDECLAYEERAAIMEYDAGLSRPDAERAAYADILAQRSVPLTGTPKQP
ncbi:MAG: hypothetical protein AAF968_08205 [Pseudomonadota bacterium]